MKVEIEEAGRWLVAWVVNQIRLRAIVRRPFAVIDGQIRPEADVVYHDPGAMK